MEEKLQDTKETVFETPSSRRAAIIALYKKHGIECVDDTAELQGKTSIVFMNSPRSDSQDKAEF